MIKAVFLRIYYIIPVRYWLDKRLLTLGKICLSILLGISIIISIYATFGTDTIIDGKPYQFFIPLFDQISIFSIIWIFLTIIIIQSSLINEKNPWALLVVVWGVFFITVFCCSSLVLYSVTQQSFIIQQRFQNDPISLNRFILGNFLPTGDFLYNLSTTAMFLSIVTSVFSFLLLILISLLLIKAYRFREAFFQIHTEHLIQSQISGFLAMRKVFEREPPNSIIRNADIALRSNLSPGETKWLLNFFSNVYGGKWDRKQFITVTSDLTTILDSTIDKLRSSRPQADTAIIYDVIGQLHEVALPLTSIQSRLQVSSDIDIFSLLNKELENESVVRIDEQFITIRPINYLCQLCKKELSLRPYWQCLQCHRYICPEDHNQLKLSGQETPTCLECGGGLIQLPFSCTGCHTPFITVEQWRLTASCPYCGYKIESLPSSVKKTEFEPNFRTNKKI